MAIVGSVQFNCPWNQRHARPRSSVNQRMNDLRRATNEGATVGRIFWTPGRSGTPMPLTSCTFPRCFKIDICSFAKMALRANPPTGMRLGIDANSPNNRGRQHSCGYFGHAEASSPRFSAFLRSRLTLPMIIFSWLSGGRQSTTVVKLNDIRPMPIDPSTRDRSNPPAPTNGRPSAISSSPGASPTNVIALLWFSGGTGPAQCCSGQLSQSAPCALAS